MEKKAYGNVSEVSVCCNEILDKKSVADHRRLCPNDVVAWNGRFQKSGKPVNTGKPVSNKKKDCSKILNHMPVFLLHDHAIKIWD